MYFHFNIPETSCDKGSPISRVYFITGHFSVAPLLIFLRTLVFRGIQLSKCLPFALSAKPSSRAVRVSSRKNLFPTYSKVVVSTADLQQRITVCHQAKVRRISQACGRKMRQVREAGNQEALGRQASCPDS